MCKPCTACVTIFWDNATQQLQGHSPALDLLAEELCLLQTTFSAITGEFSLDDLFWVIFSSFCTANKQAA